MRVTTLRFGRDLWRLLESEAALVGTSASQYIREAALARASAAIARRGEDPFDLLADEGERHVIERARAVRQGSRAVRDGSQALREGSRALRAESRQASGEASKRTARATRAAMGGAHDDSAGR